ncbi:uncharacterized protein LOC135106409 [Scylla paramamosain]|uniref:uncharacterized protein LOC135106409 n=1 Tax=Scylla paramamosain TaxID=85552 RepID=UPI0030833EDB
MGGIKVRDVLVLTVVLTVTGGASEVLLKEVRVPSVALEGDMLHLHCDYEDGSSLYTLKWYKDGLEFYRHKPGVLHIPDHSCLDDDVEGVSVDCWMSSEGEVVLKDVTSSTSGLYKCEVIGEQPTFRKEEKKGYLKVFSEALRKPRVEGVRQHYTPDDDIYLNCSSTNTQYLPTLTWLVNGHPADQKYLMRYPVGKSLGLHLPITFDLFRGGVISASCVSSLGDTHFRSTNVTLLGRGSLATAEGASSADKLSWSDCPGWVMVVLLPLLITH